MPEPKISLIVVSRDRPEGLRRLIRSLQFQFYRNFEVVVVSNTKLKLTGNIKFIEFDQANISAARNLGIQAAAGELIAFCDDDAVPEPTWLQNLAQPFSVPEVGIAGGFVRGRNGIDFQWKTQKVNQFGTDTPLILEDDASTQVFTADGPYCPKVQGTNCMFRKSVLQGLGGFDDNFAFYLDETDICYRASKQGWATAIVPSAEVQHGFEASYRRTADRVPKSLFSEGQSKAYFCKKHANGTDCQHALTAFQAEQHQRLIKLMVAGYVLPSDVKSLLKSLDAGLMAGQSIAAKEHDNKAISDQIEFRPFIPTEKPDGWGEIFAGSVFSRKRMIAAALQASQKGVATTMFCWSFTALFHRRYFDERGFWAQKGGVFGKSVRKGGYFQFATLLNRSNKEAERLEKVRKIKKIHVFRFKKVATALK